MKERKGEFSVFIQPKRPARLKGGRRFSYSSLLPTFLIRSSTLFIFWQNNKERPEYLDQHWVVKLITCSYLINTKLQNCCICQPSFLPGKWAQAEAPESFLVTKRLYVSGGSKYFLWCKAVSQDMYCSTSTQTPYPPVLLGMNKGCDPGLYSKIQIMLKERHQVLWSFHGSCRPKVLWRKLVLSFYYRDSTI